MSQDPFVQLKAKQREMWASFTPTAMFTTPVAGHLVRFAHIAPGEAVLDVGTGTGVVALTAARAGAKVTGLDLTPELLAQARDNARIAQQEQNIVWTEGDAEQLPYADASFDVVLSQFGHMFAPRPQQAVAERLGEQRFDAPFFERGVMAFPALSLAHYRLFMERSVGPIQKLVEAHADQPDKLAQLRDEFDALIKPYFADNIVRQDYLLTRAQAL